MIEIIGAVIIILSLFLFKDKRKQPHIGISVLKL